MNPYETLGVPKDADAGTIKAAYRRKARKAHPDRKDGDHGAMASINDAYALLSNPERRERFDQTGSTGTPPPREARAREIVLKGMIEALDCGRDDVDLVKLMRARLQAAQVDGKAKLSNARRSITVTEKQRKKIKDGGLFAGLFDERLLGLRRMVADIEEHLEVLTIAAELLLNVEWIGDEPGATQWSLSMQVGT